MSGSLPSCVQRIFGWVRIPYYRGALPTGQTHGQRPTMTDGLTPESLINSSTPIVVMETVGGDARRQAWCARLLRTQLATFEWSIADADSGERSRSSVAIRSIGGRTQRAHATARPDAAGATSMRSSRTPRPSTTAANPRSAGQHGVDDGRSRLHSERFSSPHGRSRRGPPATRCGPEVLPRTAGRSIITSPKIDVPAELDQSGRILRSPAARPRSVCARSSTKRYRAFRKPTP